MDYLRIYNELIENAKNRTLPNTVYTETHHIKPKCMGGNNSKNNLVKLTAREHYIAHRLLYTIYGTFKLAAAWNMMLITSSSQGDNRKFTSRQYNEARTSWSVEMSKKTGSKNPFYGRKHTQITKDKMVESRRKTYENNPELYNEVINEQKIRMSKRFKGVPKSDDHKKKIGVKSKNRLVLINRHTKQTISIHVNDRNLYSKVMWLYTYQHARLYNTTEILSCPHCNKKGESGNSSFKKWHFNNCKYSPNYVKIKSNRVYDKDFWAPWYKGR